MDYYGNNDWRDYQSLKHWKYIKREKVNGKWRYYYNTDKALSDVKAKKDKYKDLAVPKATLSDPNGTILKENVIKEDIIKENVIKEDIIKENVIKEDIIKENVLKEDVKTESSVEKLMNTKVAELQYRSTNAIAKAEKWIYDKVLGTKVGDVTAEIIGRGKTKISSWLKKTFKLK